MLVDELLDQLTVTGHRLGVVAGAAGLDRPVPTCPGWNMGDLVSHVRRVYSMASAAMRGRAIEAVEDTDDVVAGYLSDLERLLPVITAIRQVADPTTPGPPPRSFWARRMANETTVHWLDAELAADTGMVEVPTAFAADGLDELLMGLAPAMFSTADVSSPLVITILPLDVNRAWTLELTPSEVRPLAAATDRADLLVSGMVSDLYRWAWNRGRDDEVSLSGAVELAGLWHRSFMVGERR
jgi:uncharacterized protein (TIGR03083 family)